MRAISSRSSRGQSGTQMMHHTQPPPSVLCVSTWTQTLSGSYASQTCRHQTDINDASRQTGASTRHLEHMGMSIRHRVCKQTSMHKHTGHTQPSKSQHDCTQTSTYSDIKATVFSSPNSTAPTQSHAKLQAYPKHHFWAPS